MSDLKTLEELRKRLLDNPTTLSEIASEFGISRNTAKTMLKKIQKDLRVRIETAKGPRGATLYFIPVSLAPYEHEIQVEEFALISDTHFGNRYAEKEALDIFYDIVKESGIKTVFHAGDLTDGVDVYPGHYRDMVKEVRDVNDLIEYTIKHYPKKRGVVTYAIAGNHDVKLFKRTKGVDPVDQVSKRRKDIKYLGADWARVKLKNNIVLELVHPGDKPAYAKSYKIQKRIEATPFEKNPDILAMGHYHQSLFMEYQGVYTFLTGCFQGETNYTKQHNLGTSIGGWIVELETEDSRIRKIKPEWVSF